MMKKFAVILALLLSPTAFAGYDLTVGPLTIEILTADNVPVDGMEIVFNVSADHFGVHFGCDDKIPLPIPGRCWMPTTIDKLTIVTDSEESTRTVPQKRYRSDKSNWTNARWHLEIKGLQIQGCSKPIAVLDGTVMNPRTLLLSSDCNLQFIGNRIGCRLPVSAAELATRVRNVALICN